jgi:hypothetical protein
MFWFMKQYLFLHYGLQRRICYCAMEHSEGSVNVLCATAHDLLLHYMPQRMIYYYAIGHSAGSVTAR